MMTLTDCRAVLQASVLTLENSRIRREYAWNEGHLIGRQIVDVARGHIWELAGIVPDFGFPDLVGQGPAPEATV